MNLQQYFNSLPLCDRQQKTLELADVLKISRSYMYLLRQGKRRLPEKFAVPIEKATNGMVSRTELAPHMYLD